MRWAVLLASTLWFNQAPLLAGQFAYQSAKAQSESKARSSKALADWSIHVQPARLVNGSPALFQVNAPQTLQSLSAKWLDHEVFFWLDPHGKAWYGLAGISLETKPGKYLLDLTGKTAEGKDVLFQHRFAVSKAQYRRITASVPKQYTQPNAEQLKQIEGEETLKKEVFARQNPEREWSGSFLPPVKAPISDVFGTYRTFNGKVQSVHQGLDYAVPEGTPVAALNRGIVLLAQPLFFEGNCVVLDHGQGLLTIYMHLSKIEVKQGEEVKAGQRIAFSGGTGRATGPHLHVAVRWQGIYVNPATLINLALP